MNNVRRWELTKDSPYALQLAADARLSQTDYLDDQVWEIALGSSDEPAMTVQTQYGGRVGLASLVPLWTHENRVIYQAHTYHDTPLITAFAPNFIQVEAHVLPNVHLQANHIAFESQVMGGVYTLTNNTERAVRLRLELFGHVGVRGKEEKLAIVTLAQGGHALSLGAHNRLSPIVMIEDGQASLLTSKSASPKIGKDVIIPAGASTSIRWVHTGLPDIRQSIATARRWLSADWQPFLEAIDTATQAIPIIETDNPEWDAVLASSYNQVIQAVLRAAGIFPRETFVAGRLPENGFSPNESGTDHPRSWSGQDFHVAYMILPVIASIAPSIAEGIFKNYIAMQTSSGAIDMKPGAAGQKLDLLCPPVLARLAWMIFEQTGNEDFLKEHFDALQKFFAYWFEQDTDGDGIPEWADDRQLGYVAFPTFAPGMEWAQGANINRTETPDLIAYLLSEADHLQRIAETINAEDSSDIMERSQHLENTLSDFWEGEFYAYRDRDTHHTTSGMVLLEDGAGDVKHPIKRPLAVPNRVVVLIVGGVRHTPNVTLHVEGLDEDGNEISESATKDDFRWQSGQGTYTTQTVFSKVNQIRCDGLSRVYTISARTMDTTALDINNLLPLWSGHIPDDHIEKLTALALDKTRFLRPNGITMTDAASADFDPSSADGAGGVWLYWQTIMGDALIRAGQGTAVSNIVQNILTMQGDILRQKHQFAQFYHADQALGLGEKEHLLGIAPLSLLSQLVGVRILSSERVWLSQDFAWGKNITLRQHGVTINRSNESIKIEFPSGHVVELEANLEDDQLIEDPEPTTQPTAQMIALPETIEATIPIPTPPSEEPEAPKPRIIIEVEYED